MSPEERFLRAQIGGFAKWAANANSPAVAAAAAQGQREARARLDSLIAQRHLHEAVEAYADARQDLRALGLAVEQ